MEEMIMAYSDKLSIKTARFANVAFSNGSLPLGFLERLNKNQPWSCPRGIRRFFVSPQESGELCLIASIMGESGDIFFPKLDEDRDMIPFDQIAIDLLKELGLEADICASEEEARLKAMVRKDDNTRVRQHEGTTIRGYDNSTTGARPLVPSLIRPLDHSSKYPIYFFGSDTSGENEAISSHTDAQSLPPFGGIRRGL